MGAVVKVEQHGEEHRPVRRRVLYYYIGSFSTYPASALSSSFPSGVLWDDKYKIVLGQILRPLLLGSHYASSAIVLLGLGFGP